MYPLLELPGTVVSSHYISQFSPFTDEEMEGSELKDREQHLNSCPSDYKTHIL